MPSQPQAQTLPPVAQPNPGAAPIQPIPAHSDSLEKMDADEHLVATIRRHPFGIVLLYLQVGVGIAAAVALIYFLLPSFIDGTDSQVLWWLKLAGFVIILFLIFILVVATVVYRLSKLIVTDKTITQVIQEGLFNRKISQLSIADIEDATADKRGFFATILNFGTLFIETAGEVENFQFKYCPNPDHHAKLILEYRQRYIETKTE